MLNKLWIAGGIAFFTWLAWPRSALRSWVFAEPDTNGHKLTAIGLIIMLAGLYILSVRWDNRRSR